MRQADNGTDLDVGGVVSADAVERQRAERAADAAQVPPEQARGDGGQVLAPVGNVLALQSPSGTVLDLEGKQLRANREEEDLRANREEEGRGQLRADREEGGGGEGGEGGEGEKAEGGGRL